MGSFNYTTNIVNGIVADATQYNQDLTDVRTFLLGSAIHGDLTNHPAAVNAILKNTSFTGGASYANTVVTGWSFDTNNGSFSVGNGTGTNSKVTLPSAGNYIASFYVSEASAVNSVYTLTSIVTSAPDSQTYAWQTSLMQGINFQGGACTAMFAATAAATLECFVNDAWASSTPTLSVALLICRVSV